MFSSSLRSQVSSLPAEEYGDDGEPHEVRFSWVSEPRDVAALSSLRSLSISQAASAIRSAWFVSAWTLYCGESPCTAPTRSRSLRSSSRSQVRMSSTSGTSKEIVAGERDSGGQGRSQFLSRIEPAAFQAAVISLIDGRAASLSCRREIRS